MTKDADMLALSRALMDGTGLAGIVTVLRRITHEPAAFIDMRGSLLASSPTRARWPVEELRTWTPDVAEVGDPPKTVLPVPLAEDIVALLVARSGDRDRAAFELATALASLEIARLQALLLGRRELAAQVLEDVIRGYSRGDEARGRLASIGVPLSAALAHAVIVGRCSVPGARLHARPWNLHSLLTGNGDPYVRAVIDGDLVLVVPAVGAVDTVARLLLQHLRAMDPGASVGVGPAVVDPVSLTMSYLQARDAADGDGLNHARPLNLGHLLLGSADALPMGELGERVLAPLLAHDRRTGGELLRSLVVYLDCDCSASRASAELFVHRNTLRYRLNLISELTGWSPDTFDGRMHFWIAVRAYQRSGRIAPTGIEGSPL
ncbi:PucR family transcriptional regulator [Streptomyces sp. NPDC056716]|uniref:PucR family transcriptional regulator n=1 Tax=unclassified Streptomyces TaxID=2593676 RepID=UPI0036C60F5D